MFSAVEARHTHATGTPDTYITSKERQMVLLPLFKPVSGDKEYFEKIEVAA